MEETTEAKAAWDATSHSQAVELEAAQAEVARLRAAAVGDAHGAAVHKAQLDALLASTARQKAQVRRAPAAPPSAWGLGLRPPQRGAQLRQPRTPVLLAS
jgi:hypothetical protein